MRKLFQLVGEISIKGMTALNKQFSETDQKARALQKQINLLGKNIEKVGVGLSKTITAPLIGLGAAMVLAADKTGKYADAMLDLVDITGLSTDSLQELEHVANVAGVDFNGLTNTIVQFTRKLPEIVKEGGKAYDSIKALGINIYDTNGNVRDMNQLFPEMLKGLMSVKNVTERNAMATTIFGRSLNDLAPVLGMTAEGFDAAVKEAHDLNLVIGNEGLQTANDYRIEMLKLKEEFTKFWQRLSIDFIPILKDSLIPLVRDTLLPIFEKTIKVVKSVADWFMGLTKAEQNTILGTVAFVAALGPLLIIIGKAIVATKGFTSALLMLKAPLLVNPFVAAATAVTALTLLIINLRKEHQRYLEFTAAGGLTKKGIELQKEKIKGLESEAEAIKKAIKYAVESNDKTATWTTAEGVFSRSVAVARAELEAINDQIKRTNEQIGKYTETTEAATTATDKSTNSLLDNAAAEEKAKAAAEKANRLKAEQIEWEKRLIEQRLASTSDIKMQTEEKLKLLEIEKNKELTTANERGIEKQQIIDYYAREEVRIYSEQATAIKSLEDEELEYWKKIQDEKKSYGDKINEANAAQWEEYIRSIEEQQELLKNTIVGAAIETNAYISQIADNYFQKQFNNLDIQQQKEIDNINKSVMNKENKEKAIDAINKKYAKESLKLRRDQAKKDKAFAIFGAIINTALAITNAMKLVWPLNLVMAVVMGALGAVQIAAIASEPLPMKKGGLVKSGTGGIEAQIGEGAEDEIVLPMKTGVRALADALMERLGEIELPKFKTPRLAYAGAGGGSDGSVMRGGAINLHIGTFIGDESGLKELERRLLNIRISEQQRKGQEYYAYR